MARSSPFLRRVFLYATLSLSLFAPVQAAHLMKVKDVDVDGASTPSTAASTPAEDARRRPFDFKDATVSAALSVSGLSSKSRALNASFGPDGPMRRTRTSVSRLEDHAMKILHGEDVRTAQERGKIAVPSWAASPPVPPVTMTHQRPSVFAFGDFHGDYVRFRALLAAAGLAALPDEFDIYTSDGQRHQVVWLGGKSTVVFLGDVIDKGPRPFAIYAAIAILKKQAAASGGRVELLFGNHDLMRMEGDVSQAGLEMDLFEDEQVSDRQAWTVFQANRSVRGADSYAAEEADKAQMCVDYYRASRIHPALPQVRIEDQSGKILNNPHCFPQSLAEWLRDNARYTVVVDSSLFVHAGFSKRFVQEVSAKAAGPPMSVILDGRGGPRNDGNPIAQFHWFVLAAALDPTLEISPWAGLDTVTGLVGKFAGPDDLSDMVWTRDFWDDDGNGRHRLSCRDAQLFLDRLNEARDHFLREHRPKIVRFVTGHTPQATGLVAARGNKRGTTRGPNRPPSRPNPLLANGIGKSAISSPGGAGASHDRKEPLMINADVGMTVWSYNFGASFVQIVSETVETLSERGREKGRISWRSRALVRSPMAGVKGAEIMVMAPNRLARSLPKQWALTSVNVREEGVPSDVREYFVEVTSKTRALPTIQPLVSWEHMGGYPQPLEAVQRLSNGFNWVDLVNI